jgi:hypothetical protein
MKTAIGNTVDRDVVEELKKSVSKARIEKKRYNTVVGRYVNCPYCKHTYFVPKDKEYKYCPYCTSMVE